MLPRDHVTMESHHLLRHVDGQRWCSNLFFTSATHLHSLRTGSCTDAVWKLNSYDLMMQSRFTMSNIPPTGNLRLQPWFRDFRLTQISDIQDKTSSSVSQPLFTVWIQPNMIGQYCLDYKQKLWDQIFSRLPTDLENYDLCIHRNELSCYPSTFNHKKHINVQTLSTKTQLSYKNFLK